jgi:hypothetical protein
MLDALQHLAGSPPLASGLNFYCAAGERRMSRFVVRDRYRRNSENCTAFAAFVAVDGLRLIRWFTLL